MKTATPSSKNVIMPQKEEEGKHFHPAAGVRQTRQLDSRWQEIQAEGTCISNPTTDLLMPKQQTLKLVALSCSLIRTAIQWVMQGKKNRK